MIDTDSLHAAVQYPTNIVLLFLAAAYYARSRAIASGRIVIGSASIVRVNALLLAVIAAKGIFWQVRWTAKALDLDAYAVRLDEFPAFATACNAAIIILGGISLGMITRDVFGRKSEYVAFGVVASLCIAGVFLVRGAGL